MRYNLYKKGLAIGFICLLTLVSIPIVSGEEILYPKEEGPYTVFIGGRCTGYGGNIFIFFRLLPLMYKTYPTDVSYFFEQSSVFFVNNEKQEIVFPADIELRGFKGYGPTIYMILLKEYIPFYRLRVLGLCDEIVVRDSQ